VKSKASLLAGRGPQPQENFAKKRQAVVLTQPSARSAKLPDKANQSTQPEALAQQFEIT
jgi:hypothetical protein